MRPGRKSIALEHPAQVPMKKAPKWWQGRMRITIAVALLVMSPVDSNPPERASLKWSRTKKGQQGRQPARGLETLVSQQTMKADRDAKAGREIEENEQSNVHRPGPKRERWKGGHVNYDQRDTNRERRETGITAVVHTLKKPRGARCEVWMPFRRRGNIAGSNLVYCFIHIKGCRYINVQKAVKSKTVPLTASFLILSEDQKGNLKRTNIFCSKSLKSLLDGIECRVPNYPLPAPKSNP